MTTANAPSAPQAPNPTLKAYEDKISAQIQDAKGRLEQFEAKANEKRAEAEIATINRLKATKQDIDRKLQDLKTTHAAHVAQAKADIDADVAKFRASMDELATTFKTSSAKK